ncbi:MAG: DUF72 domain-containing protein [Actinomycetota bacterium]|nr:DUF72 domain-containing protein [Actinomycetota bacterium]MDQ2956338.1 DUF72 domain-containing protein [Actinomycetota bacterium]
MSAWVGISGWTYPPWRGDFYPAGLAHRKELAYAASKLSSIEINGSFYALQLPTSFHRWAAETPDDFRFAVKGGRFITHLKRLREVDVPVANFLASGVLVLADKLGPLLWQLPPTLAFDADRIAEFVGRLPHSTGEAAYLARRHDDRVAGRAWTGTLTDRPLRHAIEVRHTSFVNAQFLDLLRQNSIAMVVADTAGRWPQLFDVTADFVYVRLHGAGELYTSGYTAAELEVWADRVRGWTANGLDVYVYFDNDVKVRAPYDAMALRALLEGR